MGDKKEVMGAIAAEIVSDQIAGKKWYESKTLWANVVLGVALIVQEQYGYVISPDIQALVITGINVLLRKLTKDPIVW